MQHNVNKIVSLFDDKKNEMTLGDILIHIYLYLLFIKQQKQRNSINFQTNSKKTYDESINNFVQFINTKFEYKLNVVEYNKYIDCITKLNTELFDQSYNYNELIYNSFKQNKEHRMKQKEMKNIFTEQNVINYIYNLFLEYSGSNDLSSKTIVNLFSGSGNLVKCICDTDLTIDANNITLCENNELLNIIAYANLKINLNIDLDNLIQTDLLHDNLITDSYDIVVADLPDDIRNLIHAECCNKIKQLKIRGTKAEPLIIQLVMNLLNENGLAVIVVPNGLLFGESNQHIETRKYLINNFNLSKIVSVSDKKSILIFSKNGNTEQVEFTEINNLYNLLITTDQLKEKNYSFYYPNYEFTKPNEINDGEINIATCVSDILTIYSDLTNLTDLNSEYLVCCKTNSLKICKLSDVKPEYVFVSNNCSQYNQTFINYYLLNIFNKNFNSLTKGKVKQLDINAINSFQIAIPPITIQLNIISIIEYNNKMIELNKQQINNYELLKFNNLSNIMLLANEKLINVCKISHDSVTKETIVINRNSANAGGISLTQADTESSTNNYYLEPLTNKINKMCLFYVLKFYEPKLREISKLNNTVSLARTKLENLDVPIMTDNLNQIVEKCIKYDEKINQINNQNEILMSDISQILC